MQKTKYTLKEKLDIAESISTILMFIMAIWGSIAAYEEGFWHKLNHIVSHYHNEITDMENKESVALQKLSIKPELHSFKTVFKHKKSN
jgi:hypothetical protein